MSIQMKRIPTDTSTCGAVVSDIRIEAKCHKGGINLEVRYSKKLLANIGCGCRCFGHSSTLSSS